MLISPVNSMIRLGAALCLVVGICLLSAVPHHSSGSEEQAEALVLSVDGTINPAVSDYLRKGLLLAIEKNASLVILRLNTPGGLDASMRDIIEEILA